MHSAANYPSSVGNCYELDLESQAVLIVGYDDDMQSVAIIDPWDNSWGGDAGGRRWITYPDFSILNVNISLGMSMCLTPPQVNLNPEFDANQNLSIVGNIGFYSPRGVVMDRESWAIKSVEVECSLPEDWGRAVCYKLNGNWLVGDLIALSMPIVCRPKSTGNVNIQIKLEIQGQRPYEFNDCIKVTKDIFVNSAAETVESCNYAVS